MIDARIVCENERQRGGERARFLAVLFKRVSSSLIPCSFPCSDNYIYFSYYRDKGADRDNAAGLLSIIRYFGDN